MTSRSKLHNSTNSLPTTLQTAQEHSVISTHPTPRRISFVPDYGNIMPWLIKDKPKMSDRLFFVHVPRCGGTSLMHHFDVPKKVMKGRSLIGQYGMVVFFHRYKLLETNNFPMFTRGNGILFLLFLRGLCLATLGEQLKVGVALMVSTFILIVSLSFIFTAPTIGRIPFIRRSYLILIHYVLFRFMESIEWCTGTNNKGYMMHLTAHKLLAYGYVTPEEMEEVCSLAIVRNPYSRMVSVYQYNKFGRFESFDHFVHDWYARMTKAYRERGEMEEWYTPCHAIPQFEFTHYKGKQIVQSIVKQEELKFLKTKDDPEYAKAVAQGSSVSDLPDLVRSALLGMPHKNQRKTATKWFDYYDQTTLDLVYRMYRDDFDVFGYSPILKQRPDLKPPADYVHHDENGTQTNGTQTNGTQTNGTKTNGTLSNGTHTNGTHTNGTKKPQDNAPPKDKEEELSAPLIPRHGPRRHLESMLRDSTKLTLSEQERRKLLLLQSSSETKLRVEGQSFRRVSTLRGSHLRSSMFGMSGNGELFDVDDNDESPENSDHES